MNNPSLNASRGGGASPPLFLKYSVSFHMRGILRSVMTAERGLGHKNVNHASCLTDAEICMRLPNHDALSRWPGPSVHSQLLILQVCMHMHGAPPITRHKHKHNVRVSRLIDILSFFFNLLVTFWKQMKYAVPKGKSSQPPGLATCWDFLSVSYLHYI